MKMQSGFKVYDVEGLELSQLCPKCCAPVLDEIHSNPARDHQCKTCKQHFDYLNMFLALDVRHADKVEKKLKRSLETLKVIRRRFPLVKDGKLIKSTKGRIGKQEEGMSCSPGADSHV